jgi:hypothetical protein
MHAAGRGSSHAARWTWLLKTWIMCEVKIGRCADHLAKHGREVRAARAAGSGPKPEPLPGTALTDYDHGWPAGRDGKPAPAGDIDHRRPDDFAGRVSPAYAPQPASSEGNRDGWPVGRQAPPGQAEAVPAARGAPGAAQQLRRYGSGNHDRDEFASLVDLQRRLLAQTACMPHRPGRAVHRRRTNQFRARAGRSPSAGLSPSAALRPWGGSVAVR